MWGLKVLIPPLPLKIFVLPLSFFLDIWGELVPGLALNTKISSKPIVSPSYLHFHIWSFSHRSCRTVVFTENKTCIKWTDTVQTWVVQGWTTGIYMCLHLCSIFGTALCKHWYELESSIFKSIVNCSNTIEGLLNNAAFPPLIWNVLLVINKSLYEELLKYMMLTGTSLPLLVLSQIRSMPIFPFLKYLISLFDCVGS